MTSSEKANNNQHFLEELHDKCRQTLKMSLDTSWDSVSGPSFLFLSDLECWKKVLTNKKENVLYDAAINEYSTALLNSYQGQYRNAFKGLRLTLELYIQGIYLSANSILLNEWLTGKADTKFGAIVSDDSIDGPFSIRFCAAFFPKLSDHIYNFRTIARTVYRELSEAIHGNIPNYLPLTPCFDFDGHCFGLWHSKANVIRSVVLFGLTMRYLSFVSESERISIEPVISNELGAYRTYSALVGRS